MVIEVKKKNHSATFRNEPKQSRWLNFTSENCPTYDTLIKFKAHSMSFSTFFKKETNTSVIAIMTVVCLIDYQPELQYLTRGLEVKCI